MRQYNISDHDLPTRPKKSPLQRPLLTLWYSYPIHDKPHKFLPFKTLSTNLVNTFFVPIPHTPSSLVPIHTHSWSTPYSSLVFIETPCGPLDTTPWSHYATLVPCTSLPGPPIQFWVPDTIFGPLTQSWSPTRLSMVPLHNRGPLHNPLLPP